MPNRRFNLGAYVRTCKNVQHAKFISTEVTLANFPKIDADLVKSVYDDIIVPSGATFAVSLRELRRDYRNESLFAVDPARGGYINDQGVLKYCIANYIIHVLYSKDPVTGLRVLDTPQITAVLDSDGTIKPNANDFTGCWDILKREAIGYRSYFIDAQQNVPNTLIKKAAVLADHLLNDSTTVADSKRKSLKRHEIVYIALRDTVKMLYNLLTPTDKELYGVSNKTLSVVPEIFHEADVSSLIDLYEADLFDQLTQDLKSTFEIELSSVFSDKNHKMHLSQTLVETIVNKCFECIVKTTGPVTYKVYKARSRQHLLKRYLLDVITLNTLDQKPIDQDIRDLLPFAFNDKVTDKVYTYEERSLDKMRHEATALHEELQFTIPALNLVKQKFYEPLSIEYFIGRLSAEVSTFNGRSMIYRLYFVDYAIKEPLLVTYGDSVTNKGKLPTRMATEDLNLPLSVPRKVVNQTIVPLGLEKPGKASKVDSKWNVVVNGKTDFLKYLSYLSRCLASDVDLLPQRESSKSDSSSPTFNIKLALTLETDRYTITPPGHGPDILSFGSVSRRENSSTSFEATKLSYAMPEDNLVDWLMSFPGSEIVGVDSKGLATLYKARVRAILGDAGSVVDCHTRLVVNTKPLWMEGLSPSLAYLFRACGSTTLDAIARATNQLILPEGVTTKQLIQVENQIPIHARMPLFYDNTLFLPTQFLVKDIADLIDKNGVYQGPVGTDGVPKVRIYTIEEAEKVLDMVDSVKAFKDGISRFEISYGGEGSVPDLFFNSYNFVAIKFHFDLRDAVTARRGALVRHGAEEVEVNIVHNLAALVGLSEGPRHSILKVKEGIDEGKLEPCDGYPLFRWNPVDFGSATIKDTAASYLSTNLIALFLYDSHFTGFLTRRDQKLSSSLKAIHSNLETYRNFLYDTFDASVALRNVGGVTSILVSDFIKNLDELLTTIQKHISDPATTSTADFIRLASKVHNLMFGFSLETQYWASINPLKFVPSCEEGLMREIVNGAVQRCPYPTSFGTFFAADVFRPFIAPVQAALKENVLNDLNYRAFGGDRNATRS